MGVLEIRKCGEETEKSECRFVRINPRFIEFRKKKERKNERKIVRVSLERPITRLRRYGGRE
jgi:hypothetical protein